MWEAKPGPRRPGPGPGPDRRRSIAGSSIEGYCSPAVLGFRSIVPGVVPESRRHVCSLRPTTTQRSRPATAPDPEAGCRTRTSQAPTIGSTTNQTGRWRREMWEATQLRRPSWPPKCVVAIGPTRMATGSCKAIVRVRLGHGEAAEGGCWKRSRAAGYRDLARDRIAAGTSRVLRLSATVRRPSSRSTASFPATYRRVGDTSALCAPQPPNEAARPRSPPRRPDAGPGPRKPRPPGRPPARLVDGDATCRKLLSSEGPPGLPNALSPSGQPAWLQAPARPSSGSGSATAKRRRVGVGSEAGPPAAGAWPGAGSPPGPEGRSCALRYRRRWVT